MDRLRGRQLPTIDFNITSALNRVLARDRAAREVSRAQMLRVHVNMAVWRDRCGRLWRRKLVRLLVSLTDLKVVVYQNCS